MSSVFLLCTCPIYGFGILIIKQGIIGSSSRGDRLILFFKVARARSKKDIYHTLNIKKHTYVLIYVCVFALSQFTTCFIDFHHCISESS